MLNNKEKEGNAGHTLQEQEREYLKERMCVYPRERQSTPVAAAVRKWSTQCDQIGQF